MKTSCDVVAQAARSAGGSILRLACLVVVGLVAGAVTTQSAPAQTYKESVLYAFTGAADGASPNGGLIFDAKGNFYGTTFFGGDVSACGGCGIVFKLDSKGKETVLYTFTGGADGAYPNGGLIFDAKGNLYGTTFEGGDLSCAVYPPHFHGCGVVFKLDSKGKETVLHTFTGADGKAPARGLSFDAKGNLYGTTYVGGDRPGCNPYGYGCGVVFKLDSKGKETVLHTFTGAADGGYPLAGVIFDAAGNLYGTTSGGGDQQACVNGACGVVFKIDRNGKEKVLHKFTGVKDGGDPEAGVIFDAKGNLYGTTAHGGNLYLCGGCGVVFKIDSKGKETVLYTFTRGADGALPEAGVILDARGNLYGTATIGGDPSGCNPLGCGVVFKIGSKGKEIVLYTFTGGADGALPQGGVILDAKGNLYGTAAQGGDLSCNPLGCGVVFKVAP